MAANETPSQTIGPFFAILLPLPGPEESGEMVEITGRVLDGAGENVADALIEVSTAEGHFSRAFTSHEGFVLRVPRPAAGRPPSGPIELGLFARGLLKRVVTCLYLEDPGPAGEDSLLHGVDPARRATLIAAEVAPGRYRFDIRLQGPEETVFFEL